MDQRPGVKDFFLAGKLQSLCILLFADLAAASYTSFTNYPSESPSHISFSLGVPRHFLDPMIDGLGKMTVERKTQPIMYRERTVNISNVLNSRNSTWIIPMDIHYYIHTC